jgi:hypothetical protein
MSRLEKTHKKNKGENKMTFEEKFRKFIGTEKRYCISCEIKVIDDKDSVEYKDGMRCLACSKKYQEERK